MQSIKKRKKNKVLNSCCCAGGLILLHDIKGSGGLCFFFQKNFVFNKQMSIPVQPTSAGTISIVDINIYQLTLNYGFKCSCKLKDTEGNVFSIKDVEISGDDYNNWTNDQEMTTLILSKLNLQPAAVSTISSTFDENGNPLS